MLAGGRRLLLTQCCILRPQPGYQPLWIIASRCHRASLPPLSLTDHTTDLDHVERLTTIHGRGHAVARLFQGQLERLAQAAMVIHD